MAALALTLALCWASRDDLPKLLSMLVFGLSMVGLYAVSAVYHIGSWTGTPHRVLRAVDHSNIYLMIAGTYTPLCVNILNGSLRVAILVTIWLLAAAGIYLAIITIGAPAARIKVPRGLSTALYIIMGWTALAALPALLAALPLTAVALLALGGVLYTVGGIIYARRRPNPFPHVLGFHEIFHLLVVAGGAAFAVVIWLWVLPFPRT